MPNRALLNKGFLCSNFSVPTADCTASLQFNWCFITKSINLCNVPLHPSLISVAQLLACVICPTGMLASSLAHGSLLALKLSMNSTVLHEPIIIKSGNVLFLDGGGGTIITGQQHFQVGAGAGLCMYNLNLIDGKVCIWPRHWIFVVQSSYSSADTCPG